MDTYFVVGCTCDGTRFIGPLTEEQLNNFLKEERESNNRELNFASKIPPIDGFCLLFKENEFLVIKGSIVDKLK
jgi:hypothetical protein